ncbi:uncharacterized protein CHSO_4355 [Chryseobacterium sp. StRB126]|uniref:hypothetical protein n=1 Tax=Chryseobacterium sp. StRB126 TaxID=878220 RepID=UPI0004E98DC5|nr:hypothetical protein [Chryseobacterium sp. StRB126]BAP33392.1 uncharacterized protein CHSO_4355 [Chryseobacterium sp. StRB126]
MFKIKDKLFDLQYAYLDAFVNTDQQLVFGLQIKATGKDPIPDDDNDTDGLFFPEEELFFNSEIILKVNPNEIERWQDIAGRTIEWEDYPEDEQEPHALFYVYEHTEIYNAKIEFKTSEDKMIVKIKAACDIYAGESFSDNLPLEVETEIDFYGILCGKGTTEEQCLKKVDPYLNIDTLKVVQNKYGISIAVPKDTNMETNLLILADY